MARDTPLGFPAHTLPYRRGKFTTLSTVSPPVRANRGSLFLPAAGRFRPRLGSMEFGLWGLRRVGREGDALLVPGGQCEVIEAALLVLLAVQFR